MEKQKPAFKGQGLASANKEAMDQLKKEMATDHRTNVSRETAEAIKDGLTAIDNAVAEANITEYAENAIAEKINTVVEEKKRGGNILYTLKQFATMTNKMRDQKLIDGVQHATLQEMLKQIHAKYIGLDIWNGEHK